MRKFSFLLLFFWNVCAQANVAESFLDVHQISLIEFHGGSFWEGYMQIKINVQNRKLEANWDRRMMGNGESRESREGNKILSTNEVEEILKSISAFSPEPTTEDCQIGADGPEENIVVHFVPSGGSPMRIVNKRSRPFVCGDRYVSDESFDRFLNILKRVFPDPFNGGAGDA